MYILYLHTVVDTVYKLHHEIREQTNMETINQVSTVYRLKLTNVFKINIYKTSDEMDKLTVQSHLFLSQSV